ncbi:MULTISPECIES: PAS domain-containing sensor histidine kinase [unclassified Cupriavidus]|uniref:PAS domain-containing sensor histidine kinase n=1 Tax=Cupriavidus sp. H19C3 TaxID=3241603 RepID=UPI003BF8B407
MHPNSRMLSIIAGVLALAIFVVDALTPLDIAIAVLYVVVVLLVASTGSRAATITASAICACLTVLGFFISSVPTGGGAQLGRCLVSLLANSTATLLALRGLGNTARLREQIQMLNLTHDAIVVHDMNDIITFWNRGAHEVYGWTAAEAVGQSIHALTRTTFPIPLEHIHDELLRTGRWDGEVQRVRKDGQLLTISSRWALWRDDRGKPVAIVATSNDITDRKRAEAALARSEAFLSEAQRLSKTGSIALQPPYSEMTWSPEAYRILGYDTDVTPSPELISARTHPDDLGRVSAARQMAREGKPYIDVEHRLLMPDGAVRYVHFVARRTNAAPLLPEYVGALMDVTDAAVTQEALQRSQAELAHVTRVTTLGELAASIAHEVSQPLAAIVTCGDSAVRWLNRAQPEVAEAQQSIGQMIRDARRATDIIHQIRSMAKKRDPVYERLDINVLVTEAASLVRREFQANRVEPDIRLAPSALYVSGDRVQLHQVLINLLVNAVQAMAGIHDRRRDLWVVTERVQGVRFAAITVRDAGCGFPPADADKLFNAFYSTKKDGMGMGLSICRSIVEAHGGRIWAESPPQRGATLRVELPMHEEVHQ